MDRRQFLKSGAAASAAVSVPLVAEPAKKPSGKRPNVLYVFSDQHRASSMPGEVFSQVTAPALDRFRRDNLSMEQCISNYPLCVPHRGILLSGLYPYQSNVIGNGSTLEPKVPGLGEVFAKAGYSTGWVGKWHLYQGEGVFVPPGPYRFGFETWQVWSNTNKHHDGIMFNPVTGEKETVPGYQPTRMTDQAIEFLDKQKGGEKPWLLVLSWNPPHPPFDPPPADRDIYTLESLKMRPNVRMPTDADKLTNPYPGLESPAALRAAEQGYYGGITAVDKEFARLLKKLDDLGMTEDTIVVYTSDHGEMMGSHGHMAKQMPHEESCHVPFYVRVPGSTKKGLSNSLFATVDIYPTVCGLAGVPVPAHCSGRDFSGHMRSEGKWQEPEMVFLLNNQGPPTRQEVNVQTYRGVRTKTHTYAVQLDGRWVLYDNTKDPYQMKNLVKEPGSKELIVKLEKALLDWGKSMNDPFPYEKAFQSYSTHPGT